MSKVIWLPDSKTNVMIEDGNIKVWDNIVMTKHLLSKKEFGFGEEKEEVVLQTD